MARQNRCTNPSLTNNVTGWGGGSTPTRQTGISGFLRTTVARYTSGTFMISQAGAATAGQVYTLSVYARTLTNTWSSPTIYAEWRNGGGGVISYSSVGLSAISANVVTRMVLANVTAPANTASVAIVTDGQNFGTSNTEFTAALIEQAATAQAFFDGDSVGGSWDGTAGNSSSTLADAVARAPRMTSQYGSYF